MTAHRLLASLLTAIALTAPLRAYADPASPKQPLVVVIDAGHGGRDFGAQTRQSIEKNIVLDIARRLSQEIGKTAGLTPVLTRDSDEFISLSDRVDRAEKAGGRVLVSIHTDKVRSRSGVFLYYFGKNRSIPKGPHRSYGEKMLPAPPPAQIEASRQLAARIENRLRLAGFKINPLDRGGFLIFKGRGIPSVLIEVGNLSNGNEAKKLTKPDYQKRLAQAIARGLQDFLVPKP